MTRQTDGTYQYSDTDDFPDGSHFLFTTNFLLEDALLPSVSAAFD